MTHSHTSTVKRLRFVAITGMCVNLLLVACKASGGILFGSQTLLADAFHSLSDLITDFAVLFGVGYWSAPPDDSHPYGHGRIETLISAFIGLALAGTAAGLAWNAVTALRGGAAAQPGVAAFFIASLSVISKEWLFRWTRRAAKQMNSTALEANAWHHRSDALSSIPAAIAIMIASVFPQLAFIDRLGAILVALFILHAAWKIVLPTLQELSDAGVCKAVCDRIAGIALGVDGIEAVHKVRARNAGGCLIADLHIMVNPEISVEQGHCLSHQVRNALLESELNIKDAVIHLEPYQKEVS